MVYIEEKHLFMFFQLMKHISNLLYQLFVQNRVLKVSVCARLHPTLCPASHERAVSLLDG